MEGEKTGLSDLPDDCSSEIVKFLPVEDICSLISSNKKTFNYHILRNRIIESLQKAIKESSSNGRLEFNKNIVILINKSKILTDEAFNTLDQEFKDKIKEINCAGKNLKYFPLLTKGFNNVEYLNCANNEIDRLDFRGLKKLCKLNCSNNKIEELYIKGLKNLKQLFCFNNKITKLDFEGIEKLEILYCDFNRINKLKNLQKLKELEILVCSFNRLKKLDVSELSNLTILICFKNKIRKLDVSKLANFTEIYCFENRLLKKSIKQLKVLKLNGAVIIDPCPQESRSQCSIL